MIKFEQDDDNEVYSFWLVAGVVNKTGEWLSVYYYTLANQPLTHRDMKMVKVLFPTLENVMVTNVSKLGNMTKKEFFEGVEMC